MSHIYSIIIACLAFINLQATQDYFIVGTNTEFPPFSYIENGEIVGFDIDIAKEVSRRLGKELKFKDMPFDALIPELALGQVDFVAAGISITEERAKRVLFTEPYMNNDPLVIFSMTSTPLSEEDLQGKTVVVVEGYVADLYMSEKSGFNLIRLPTQADAFLAVKCGRAAAFVTASTTVDQFTETQKNSKFLTYEIPGTSETCALVVPKSKPEVLVQLQTALDAMRQDGTLDLIKNKWKIQ